MRKLILPILLIISVNSSSQTIEPANIKGIDIQGYTTPPFYSEADGKKYNAEEFYNHPDFGKLTFKSPDGKTVVEDISQRTAFKRYYIDLADPTYFYIEQSAIPINFFDGQYWRAIDPSLHHEKNGIFQSGYQPYPTTLNADQGFTVIKTASGEVSFNQFKLKRVFNDDHSDLIDPNWSNTTVNNFGCYVSDIFPGIDLKIKFSERKVKSDFIIKQDLGLKSIVFIDELNLPSNLDLLPNTDGLGQERVQIYDMNTSDNVIIVEPARSHDNSGNKESWYCDYTVVGHEIHLTVDSMRLNDINNVFPLTIDPTFVAVGPVAAGFPVSGSLIYPAACTDVINVTFPGGSTPWDADVSATILADFCAASFFFPPIIDCWASEQGFWVTSGCGGVTPATGTWGCTIPACDASGAWILNSGFNTSGTQSLVQCYTPSCSNQVMTFTMNFARAWCPTYAGYDDCDWGDSYCETLDDWGITIQGRTTETLSNTVTGNGSLNIYDPDCAGTQNLDPTPLYGVPGYTYAWSPGGATTPTLTVPGTISIYTCDVTDACGSTVTATFNIGCPLSAEELTIIGEKEDGAISVIWSSQSEKEIHSFTLEKSIDGNEWVEMTNVDVAGQTTKDVRYETLDENPAVGVNMYRVSQILTDGTIGYSKATTVEFREEFSIFPNPATSVVQIEVPGTILEGTSIVISDLLGKIVMTESIKENSIIIDVSSLDRGNYFIRMERDKKLLEMKRLTLE